MAKKKKLWLKIGLPVLAVILIGGFAAANLNRSEKATEVTVERVSRGRLVETVSGTGRVQPEIQVKISANVSGRITELRVKEGDRVARGDLLVRLDRERYEAVVEQARSSQKSAEAGLEKARSELGRIRELNSRGMASQAELEAAEAQFQLSSAEVEQTQAMLKQAQDDLAKTSIYSPMDGIVSQVNKEVGEIAMGAQFQEDVILVVADLSRMEVVVEVDENDIVNVSLQDSARVTIDAYPDTTFRGSVREIAHTATTRGMGTAEELTNFEVKIAMLEVPERLRPGMSATADVITNVAEEALRVPIQCVVMREPAPPEGSKAQGSRKKPETAAESDTAAAKSDRTKPEPVEVVFRIDVGSARQTPVETGISSDTDIQILSGLAEGDTVVSGPFRTVSQKLKDGEKVKVRKSGGARGEGERGQESGAPDQEMMDEM